MSTPPWQSNLLALRCGFRQQLSSVLADVLLLPQQVCGLQPWYVPCLLHGVPPGVADAVFLQVPSFVPPAYNGNGVLSHPTVNPALQVAAASRPSWGLAGRAPRLGSYIAIQTWPPRSGSSARRVPRKVCQHSLGSELPFVTTSA